MSFRRNDCMGSMHGAVCIPSRAMLHTGRDHFGLDVQNFEGCRALGEMLGEARYRTFATGKWHNGKKAFKRSVTHGRWKLIRYPAVDVTQLFDLASDPDELLNLAG